MVNKKGTPSHQPSHLKDLILLFAIPIGIAILAVAAVYTPRLLANPKYDFVYSVCSSYSCSDDFSVDSSGHISQRAINRDYYREVTTLRYYSVKDNSTRSLTPEEAKRYQLNASSKSPDGYSLTKEDRDSGFLFWGSHDSGWYLKDGIKKKKIELSTVGSYSSRDVTFLGWVNT